MKSGDTLLISIQHGGPGLFTFDNHDPERPAPDALSHRDSGGGKKLS